MRIKEPVNGITHIIGALLSIVALVFLVSQAAQHGTVWHVVAFSIYGVSLVALYTMSSLYHSLNVSQKTNRTLEQLDHAMIYFLIAGSYTPICLVALRGGWGWSLLGVVWSLAITGIVLKLVFRDPPRVIVAILFSFYIIIGWLGLIAWAPLVQVLSNWGIFWFVLGGVFYTVGAIIFNTDRLRLSVHIGAHEIWHFFVMAGSLSHFWVMLKYVSPLG